jgi:hypothetical protein
LEIDQHCTPPMARARAMAGESPVHGPSFEQGRSKTTARVV